MSEAVSNLLVMTEIRFPKTPAQAYRETTADVVAYNVGIALRIIWEVAKPIMKWTAIITLAIAAGGIYFLWQLIFGTMKK